MRIIVICITLLSPAELVVEGSLGVIGKRRGRLASDDSGWLKAHLLPFQITLKGIEEKPVMRDGKPKRERDQTRLSTTVK
jgi:hypothetical protein